MNFPRACHFPENGTILPMQIPRCCKAESTFIGSGFNDAIEAGVIVGGFGLSVSVDFEID